MILLSHQGWSPAAIASLLGYDPLTVRRWLHRYNHEGVVGLIDRPRRGRPRLGSPRLGGRIRRLLAEPRAWTPAGRQGDPDRDQLLAALRQTIAELPEGSVVPAEDETHLNLLASVRAWLANSPTLTIQGRVRQVHAFFRARTPAQMLTTAMPSSSPWLPDGYEHNFRSAA
jgi:Winged helix-turn helix